jgi:hypothetical protein
VVIILGFFGRRTVLVVKYIIVNVRRLQNTSLPNCILNVLIILIPNEVLKFPITVLKLYQSCSENRPFFLVTVVVVACDVVLEAVGRSDPL